MSCSKLRDGPVCGSACQSSFYFLVCPSLLLLAALPGTQRHQELKAVPPETVVQLLHDVVVAFAIPISSMRGKIKFKAPIGLPWWFSASTAGGTGLIPGHGNKIPHAAWHSQNKTKTQTSTRTRLWPHTGGGHVSGLNSCSFPVGGNVLSLLLH